MRITGPGSIGTTGPTKTKGGADRKDGPRFSDLLRLDEDQPKTIAATAPVASVSALLAVQEDGSREQERKRQIRRGQDMLEILDAMRHGLLSGNMPAERIEKLLEFVQSKKGQVDDPQLESIIQEIELRAMVELAKLGKTIA